MQRPLYNGKIRRSIKATANQVRPDQRRWIKKLVCIYRLGKMPADIIAGSAMMVVQQEPATWPRSMQACGGASREDGRVKNGDFYCGGQDKFG